MLVCIAVGVITYIPLCAWRVPEIQEELRDLLQRRAGRRTGAVPAPAGS
jgi:hypothetical protein